MVCRSSLLFAAALSVVAGCGDDDGSGAGGGTTSSQSATGSAGTTSTSASTSAATTSSSGGAGDGSCASPLEIPVPFEMLDASSADGSDDVASNCEPVPMPETVFRVTFATERTVTIEADAPSSEGISLEIRAEGCAGALVGCEWQVDGGLEQVMTLPAGSWGFIVQRNPAGSFTFRVTE